MTARNPSISETDNAMHPLTYLLIAILIVTWARLYRPVRRHIEGTTLQIAPLPLLAKIRMHLWPTIGAFLLATGLVLTGNLPWWGLAAPIVSTILLLTLPVHYTITDRGIRLGWTEFRRWTEFAGVRRARFGARLVGVSGKRGLAIWLSGSRDDDDFLHFLRQTQKQAYKGQPGSLPADTNVTALGAIVSEPAPPSIAAFTTADPV